MKEQALRKITWDERIVRPMLWGQTEAWHVQGSERRWVWQGQSGQRVGETHSITWHLKFLPATSATKTYHLHLQQIWTLSHGSVFYFCFTFSWQAKNMNKKDKRLKIMNEILNGIKVRSRGYSWPFSVCNDGRSWS